MKKLTIALSFCAFATTALAEEARDLAETYVNLPQVQQMITDMFAPENMQRHVAASLPQSLAVTDAQMQRIGEIMSSMMNDLRPRMSDVMIESSAIVFAPDELSALIAFYSSEHGAAIMTKMQPFMAQVMAEMTPDIVALQQKLGPQIAAILQEGN